MNSAEKSNNLSGMQLTLKNLYRLLTQPDVPIYSQPVLPAKGRKNLTLVSFWTENLLYDFRSGPCGKMVWRTEGSQNRYLSQLCNRADNDICERYFAEWQPIVDAVHLREQAELFGTFLLSHSYNRGVFRARCAALPDVLKSGDPLFTSALCDWLKKAAEFFAAGSADGEESETFFDAWFFTVLALLALAGTKMPSLAAMLMSDPSMQAEEMQRSKKAAMQPSDEVKILSAGGSELRSRPLPGSSFFGREEELYDLLEAVQEKKKILLTGIGGIGKTELLRQLLCTVLQEKTVSALVTVPFHEDLAGSVAMSCPQPGFKAEEILHSVIFRLNSIENGKTLFLVDNVETAALSEEDTDQLLSLKGAVILSSRDREVPGFETVSLGPVSAGAAELIFRSVYSSALDAQERRSLQSIMQKEPMRHTLLIRTLALAAKTRRLSVQQALSLFPMDEDSSREFSAFSESRIFSRLYREYGLSAEEKAVVRLFSILPYMAVSEEELLAWFTQVLPPAEKLNQALNRLSESGWLESGTDGWVMHPVIAASLRKKSYTEAELWPILQQLADRNCRIENLYDWYSISDSREKYVARSVFSLAEGKLSRIFLKDHLMISSRNLYPHSYQAALLERFYKQITACPDADDSLLMQLACWNDSRLLPDNIFAEMLAVAEKDQGGEHGLLYTLFLEIFADSCVLAGRVEEAKHFLQLSALQEQNAHSRMKRLDSELMLYHFTGDQNYLEEISESLGQFPLSDTLPENLRVAYTHIKITTMLVQGNPEVFDLIPSLQQRLETMQPGGDRMAVEADLSMLLLNTQQYEEAAELFVKTIHSFEEYGAPATDILSQKRLYAVCLNKIGCNAEAAAIYEELLAGNEIKSMPGQWDMLQQSYAMLLIDMGRAAEALPILEKLLEGCRNEAGPARANTLRSLAICCKALKKRKAAKNYLRRALPEIRACYGAGHPRTAELEIMAQELGLSETAAAISTDAADA